MKKWMLWMVTVLMMITACAGAMAEDVVPYELGEGETGLIVYVMPEPDTQSAIPFIIWTDADNVMDALLDAGLIEVSEASWGYMIDSVLTVAGNENGNGLYWNIMKYDEQKGSFVKLETAIQYTPVVNGEGYLLVLQ